MIIIISNLILILLLWLYKHFINKNRINDNKGNERKYGWREYSALFGFINLFNANAFLVGNDFGYLFGTIGLIFIGIGYYSGGFGVLKR